MTSYMPIRFPKQSPSVSRGHFHVWRVDLSSAPFGSLRDLLSPDETARADRFRFPEHQDRFVAARGTLRLILSKYLGDAPQVLSFRYNDAGKPYIPGFPLHFNLSHSGSEMLLAVGSQAVGIDLEQVRNDLDVIDLARAHFALDEIDELLSLATENRTRRFFEAWVSKEALAKALGVGITGGLASTKPDWIVRPITVSPGYAASIAAEGVWTVDLLDWHYHI
ncbi:MAG: 4-phosphopantetheinyl transferase [Chthoniobacter sp.]|nr:4-phosphopantetheinyl transferase [Chthoniobacter sp.]